MKVYHGDAVNPETWRPLDDDASLHGKHLPNLDSVDVILSLDSCYHYNTRRLFLCSSYASLKPNGILAVTDIILPEGKWDNRHALRLISFLTGIPFVNFQTENDYRKMWREIGILTYLIAANSNEPIFRSRV